MNQRIENKDVDIYIRNLAISKLSNCKEFVEVFGKNFASKKVKLNMGKVYTNESRGDCGGYYNSADNSITICKSGPDGALLTPDDIENDRGTRALALHETVHAVLKRSLPECIKLGIHSGTGMKEIDKYRNSIGERAK